MEKVLQTLKEGLKRRKKSRQLRDDLRLIDQGKEPEYFPEHEATLVRIIRLNPKAAMMPLDKLFQLGKKFRVWGNA